MKPETRNAIIDTCIMILGVTLIILSIPIRIIFESAKQFE